MVSPPTKKNSSNLNESQELSGPLQKKKMKSGKILKTFTHAVCMKENLSLFENFKSM
jgi:hypothetical protein